MTPTVSVIIPSYNHENFVRECIEGVLNQTYQDFEIIVTDDHSTDRTVEIIESFTDPRITLFVHTKNKGACIAANHCIKHARGKYIAMLSSDDAWYPEKLARQVRYMEEHSAVAAVFTKVDWIDENSNHITEEDFPYKNLFEVENRTRQEWLALFFSFGNCLCHPSSLIRKDAYYDVGLLNPSFANLPDFDLWVRLCLKYDIMILDDRLVRYRWMSNQSNASSDTQHTQIRIQFEYKKMLDHYLSITQPDELLAIFPEAHKYGSVTAEIIPYFLGRLAMETGIDFKILWGLESIYTLLQNETAAQAIEEYCNFTYLDFIRLTSENDVYHLEPLRILNAQVAEQDQALQSLTIQLGVVTTQLAGTRTQLAKVRAQLTEIMSSNSWKFVARLQQIRLRLAPPGSLRSRILRRIGRVLLLPFRNNDEKRTIEKELALLRASELFDERWYLSNNPDVAENKLDPAHHYLLSGAFEGRDPGPRFSSSWYLDAYEDVRAAGINPLVHFLEKGVVEGRVIHPTQTEQKADNIVSGQNQKAQDGAE